MQLPCIFIVAAIENKLFLCINERLNRLKHCLVKMRLKTKKICNSDSKLVRISKPKYYLCTQMIIDDKGQPKQLRDWALTYVLGLIYMNFQTSFINLALFVGFDLIIVGYFIQWAISPIAYSSQGFSINTILF